MRNVARSAALVFMIVLGACSEKIAPGPETDRSDGLFVSNLHTAALKSGAIVGPLAVRSADSMIVYVSVAQDTWPGNGSVEITNRSTGIATIVDVVDGGIDPYSVNAEEGDVIQVKHLSVVSSVLRSIKVPNRKPPTVVRSSPSKGRIDVALNVIPGVVFSEPIDPASANATSIRLMHNGVPVPGTVELTVDHLIAELNPAEPLLSNEDYSIEVTGQIRDGDGDLLDAPYTTTFVTGNSTSLCPHYAIPTSCPPFPTGGPFSISGVVNERTVEGLRPFVKATVYGWIQRATNGYATGGARTNNLGAYGFSSVPGEAWYSLYATAAGFDQPCAAIGQINGNVVSPPIELVSSSHPLPQFAITPPVVRGVILEQTPQGAVPVAGARVFFDAMTALELIAATTTSDESGHYSLCRLSTLLQNQRGISVWKEGYEVAAKALPLSLPAETILDFEIKREQ